MRLDLLLKSLCLVKTRSQGRKGFEAGRVKLNGSSSKPSREVHSGDIIEIQFPGKTLVVEVSDIPAGKVSRKKAEEYYRVVRETMRSVAPDRRLSSAAYRLPRNPHRQGRGAWDDARQGWRSRSEIQEA